MTETKHTPGPLDWLAIGANASGGHHLYIVDSAGRKIGACWGKAEEKAANAALWSAGPELLAEVKESTTVLLILGGTLFGHSAKACKVIDEQIRRNRAVIAKATGVVP